MQAKHAIQAPAPQTPEATEALFTGPGGFAFARWSRPIVPVVFGVEDATLATIKGAIEAVTAIAGHRMATSDRETGANFYVFFLRDWAELAEAPVMAGLLGDPAALAARLAEADAGHYRAFRFDAESGGIAACITLIRMDEAAAALPAEVIALDLAVQGMLLWGEGAFAAASPLATLPDGGAIVRPDIANLLRAAYDPVLPDAGRDPALALRLHARAATR